MVSPRPARASTTASACSGSSSVQAWAPSSSQSTASSSVCWCPRSVARSRLVDRVMPWCTVVTRSRPRPGAWRGPKSPKGAATSRSARPSPCGVSSARSTALAGTSWPASASLASWKCVPSTRRADSSSARAATGTCQPWLTSSATRSCAGVTRTRRACSGPSRSSSTAGLPASPLRRLRVQVSSSSSSSISSTGAASSGRIGSSTLNCRWSPRVSTSSCGRPSVTSTRCSGASAQATCGWRTSACTAWVLSSVRRPP